MKVPPVTVRLALDLFRSHETNPKEQCALFHHRRPPCSSDPSDQSNPCRRRIRAKSLSPIIKRDISLIHAHGFSSRSSLKNERILLNVLFILRSATSRKSKEECTTRSWEHFSLRTNVVLLDATGRDVISSFEQGLELVLLYQVLIFLFSVEFNLKWSWRIRYDEVCSALAVWAGVSPQHWNLCRLKTCNYL